MIWLVAAPGIPESTVRPSGPAIAAVMAGSFTGRLISLDSISFRPISRPVATSGARDSAIPQNLDPDVSRLATITTWQGSRYHPESIRALADDSAALASAAGAIAQSASATGNGIVLDFQGATPDDLPELVSVIRAVSNAAREQKLTPIGVVVPAGDTLGYPTSILARVADLIIIRLHGEHRPGTRPGPLSSPRWATRHLGIRAVAAGANRLVAELPLFGYRWENDGTASLITYEDAQKLVIAEAGSFRRDPPSQFVTASGRDGWTVWVPDARTVESMISIARQRGVFKFTLAGVNGADAEIWARLPAALRR